MLRAVTRLLGRSRGPDGVESQGFLAKWALLGTVIGIVAGLGAALFFFALELATELFLGRLGGYMPPMPVGEGGGGPLSAVIPWTVPLVLTLGGALSGLIVAKLAPEAEGHGTDAAIASIHRRAGRVRRRIPFVKLAASAITIGSGGSGGREGPAAQISAGFGSMLADWLRLSANDRRIAVAAGMGAGIGAIFRAPLGGAVMAAEILYLNDLETDAIVPGLISSIVGYSVFGAIYGFEPIFGAQPHIALDSPLQLPYYAVLGVACGAVGILYAKTFYGVSRVFRQLRWPAWLKPAVGGLAVGFLALALPQVLHTGYGWVQHGMSLGLLEVPMLIVLLLPFAKILATSLSIGSGGSGGIFGPGMVIGGLLGAALWRLGHGWLPELPPDPAPFVIVGMMALFGGIAHAPLAMMLMVAEMTGNLSLLAPAMIAVALATVLVGERTIYTSQLPDRSSSPAHRVRLAFPLLSSLRVRDAMRPAIVVPAEATVASAAKDVGSDGAVVMRGGQVVGTITPMAVAAAPPDVEVSEVMSPCSPLSPELPLDEALQAIDSAEMGWLPVVEESTMLGRVGIRGIVRTYKATLGRGVRRVTDLPPETTLLEAVVTERSPLAHRSLSEARLPPATLVTSLLRDGTVVYPRGDTVIEPADRLTILTATDAEDAVKSYLAGT